MYNVYFSPYEYMYFRREGKAVEGESVLQAYSWQGRGASSKNNPDIVTAFFCTSNGKIASTTLTDDGLVSVYVTHPCVFVVPQANCTTCRKEESV